MEVEFPFPGSLVTALEVRVRASAGAGVAGVVPRQALVRGAWRALGCFDSGRQRETARAGIGGWHVKGCGSLS